MSLRYVDTSILVAALAKEAHTPRAQRWLATAALGELAISDWGIAEFSSALSIKMRTGQIKAGKRAEALRAFSMMLGQSLEVLPVVSGHFVTAARFSDQYSLGLRAADALHLAVAADRGATLYTLDKRLVAAANALNIAAKRV